MNQVPRAAIGAHIRKELSAAGVRILKTDIGIRVGFATAMLYGSAPCLMRGSDKAAEEISALVDEITRIKI
jgi:hypothetical protein